ncbi:N-methyl-L-tryptophan oxidase [Lentibacillus halophilus]|uniref:N-methyl-L-tryptophan oxidase n=1 Tax=Lentibacillus halophilus TaxID=295065 RepID=A0ABN0Z552_9BACI
MKTDYDVIIVGAGSMGMAAGYYLARQGVHPLLVDAFDPPHENGSHSGNTRLIRHACGEGIAYVPLAIKAQELWDELQDKTSDPIFRKTGVVNYAPKGSAFINQVITGGNQYGLHVEELSGNDIQERWPGNTVPDDYYGCYEPNGGVLFADNCIRTYRKLALQSGAELMPHTPVADIDISDDAVSVRTGTATYSADKLIVSAGAWNKTLLSSLNLDLPLQPSRRPFGWFDADEELYSSDAFPGFFVECPSGVYYGFPSMSGNGLKIGRFDAGQDVNPTYMDREFGVFPDDEGDLRQFLDAFMPQAAGQLNVGGTCMFTNTPDENFIIDRHPEHSHVAIAAGFSGHGFKFSSVVGEILSQLTVSGATEHDISPFSATRPALQGRAPKS